MSARNGPIKTRHLPVAFLVGEDGQPYLLTDELSESERNYVLLVWMPAVRDFYQRNAQARATEMLLGYGRS